MEKILNTKNTSSLYKSLAILFGVSPNGIYNIITDNRFNIQEYGFGYEVELDNLFKYLENRNNNADVFLQFDKALLFFCLMRPYS